MTAPGGYLLAWLRRAVDVRPGEVRALLWSFGYFFCLLCSYYILRPLRDEMGIAHGVDKLQWLFTGTFLAMLLAVPLFGAIVARFPRRRFLPLVYRFFGLNILIFFALMHLGVESDLVAGAFFIWISLFNLFVVSVFWSFMADLFANAQGKRLFGFIAAGGSAGAILGPSLTALLAVPLGPVNLLLVSVLFLELAVLCIRRLIRVAPPPDDAPAGGAPGVAGDEEPVIGGGVLAGATLVARSPYLLGICAYILLFTATSTVLYFQQANLVAAAFDDPAERTRVFALIDLTVGLLTIAVQCCLTGRLFTRFGIGFGLAFLPLLTFLGFLAFALVPQLGALVAFQSLRRAANFAISKPAREVLFTVVSRELKYKCKNFIDTVVYRGGDAASGWFYAAVAGLGLQAVALLTLPLAALWLGLALTLGRRQERLAQTGEALQARA